MALMERAGLAEQAAAGSACRGHLRHPSRSVLRAVVVGGIVFGVVLRAWLLFHDSVSADSTVVGLMAQRILHGHFLAFYPGQVYGGVEPYMTAALFALFGQSAFTLTMTPASARRSPPGRSRRGARLDRPVLPGPQLHD